MKRFTPSECQFLRGVLHPKDWPGGGDAEFVFWGRSNVGKSSLLNALTERKNLAHVSKSPGRTQGINFYQILHGLRYVDLPGYGYARVSREAQRVWHQHVSDYLATRSNIQVVFILIDSRRDVQVHDQQVVEFLHECSVSFQFVYTKIDQISQVERCQLSLFESIPAGGVYAVSASTGEGISELRRNIVAVNGEKQ